MAAADGGAGFRLSVLNPVGRDPEQNFHEIAEPDARAHAPVNFHAYAACTGGSFFRETARAMAAKNPVLLLLRGDFRESERALTKLKKAGVPVAVSLKETGLHQIAEQLGSPARLQRFLRIVAETDGCIAPTAEAADIFRSVCERETQVAFIPTPYPTHDPRWDFSRPIDERRGIFIGTREWDIASRGHCAALLAARRMSDETGERITVFNLDGWKEDRLLAEIGFPSERTEVLKCELPYADYLRVVSRHKIVFQLDTSFVPGQVAGDALLCRLPCVGGNGTIDRLAFPALCGFNRPASELAGIATNLLRDGAAYGEAIEASQRRAAEHLSFTRIAENLETFCAAMVKDHPR